MASVFPQGSYRPNEVAYWDFDTPVTSETKRDSSGTAARATTATLAERHQRPNGILGDGCFDPKNDKAVANELIWGDYFCSNA